MRYKLRLAGIRIQEICRYYRHKRFASLDLTLSILYLFSNPYRMCRKFSQSKGLKEIYTYGETPLKTLEQIVQAFHVTPADRWLELGCGRGRTCLWLSTWLGCSVRGVDWVPAFIARASLLLKLFSLPNLTFQNSSIFHTDFSWPTVVFLYSTCMSDEEIQSLLLSMNPLPPNAKVITISSPLNHPQYPLVRSLKISLPWGKTRAYLHHKISSP